MNSSLPFFTDAKGPRRSMLGRLHLWLSRRMRSLVMLKGPTRSLLGELGYTRLTIGFAGFLPALGLLLAIARQKEAAISAVDQLLCWGASARKVTGGAHSRDGVLLLTLAILILVLPPLVAHGAPESADQTLIDSIKALAKRDALAGRAPESPQDLYLVFGRDSERQGLPLVDVVRLYDEAYQAANAEKVGWHSLLPNPGWIVAALLSLLLIFRDALREALKNPLNRLGEEFYKRVSGYTLFQKGALKRYRDGLSKKYSEFRIPFGSSRVLNMLKLYVPLKAKGSTSVDQVEASSVMERYKRIVVIGAPGAGKSMLLRRVALSYATGGSVDYGQSRYLPEKPVPVLLELRRLNNADKPIEEHLADILELNGFRRARRFLDSSLEQGKLLLLLDGLDEVNSAKRGREVEKIKDLVTRYQRCGFLVTCRTAVYKGDFAEESEQTLEIMEFTDQQIQSFLGSWPSLPPEKSMEQLLIALRERPRIMSLARNPLLLTIIAFLYVDMEEFVLPHSRTEFYTRAVTVLLQMKEELNQYTVNNKLLVLEHLGIFNQSRGWSEEEDRLSLDLKTVLSEVNRVLPQLNLDAKDSLPLIKEIVERSGILLEIDNRTRYQFSHLTLQEYFTASGLRQDGDKLLANFRRDPDAWGETVKLWCGFPHDSTRMIQSIYEGNAVAAFECLADVQKIDQALAETIVDSFRGQLRGESEDENPILTAFAAVASGPSHRSRSVFDYLVTVLTGSAAYEDKIAAAKALSRTNQPRAAKALGDFFPTYPELSTELIRMGDLAVPALGRLARQGNSGALWALHTIGTPQAASSIVPMLWTDLPEEAGLSGEAALVLASLLDRENVERALADYDFHADEKLLQKPWHAWAWRPFEDRPGSNLGLIAGRISWLMDSNIPGKLGSVSTIDRRIAIPLCVKARAEFNIRAADIIGSMTKEERLETRASMMEAEMIKGYDSRITGTRSDLLGLLDKQIDDLEERDRPGEEHVAHLSKLFRLVPPSFRLRLMRSIFSNPPPTLDHWKVVRQARYYDFNESPHLKIVWSVALLLSVASFFELGVRVLQSSPWLAWRTFAVLGLLALQVLATGIAISDEPNAPAILATYGAFFYFPYIKVKERRFVAAHTEFGDLIERAIFFLRGVSRMPRLAATTYYVCFTPVTIWYATKFFLRALDLPGALAIWAVSCIVVTLSLTLGLRKERRAANPLRALFAEDDIH
jgi:hypothetical protein